MARINIEDSLFTDERFLDLIVKAGNQHLAKGMVLSAFMLAQKTWIEFRGIPIDRWPEDLNLLIETKIASVSGGLVSVIGSKEQFAWLDQKSQAGKKGGKSKSPKKLKNLAQNSKRDRNETETKPKREVNVPKPLTLSLSLTTNSFSNSNSNSNSFSEVPSEPDEPATQPAENGDKKLNSLIWESFRSAYVLRYKAEPVRNAKINSIVANLRKRLGEDAVAVVQFYVGSNNGFYLSKTHGLEFCLKDAESLHVQWQKGRAITRADVQAFEKQAVMADTLQAIKDGNI